MDKNSYFHERDVIVKNRKNLQLTKNLKVEAMVDFIERISVNVSLFVLIVKFMNDNDQIRIYQTTLALGILQSQ